MTRRIKYLNDGYMITSKFIGMLQTLGLDAPDQVSWYNVDDYVKRISSSTSTNYSIMIR